MKSEELPSRAFQSVSADYFQHAGRAFLVYVDRFSGWPIVKAFFRHATAEGLMTTLRTFFAATGIPEVFRSDNGPQFTAHNFGKFLKAWGVRLVTSSPYYPQSNGHAEAGVKSVKHLIIKCTKNGNLDTDEFAAGLLELRNTPRADGQSPAQVLFGHPLRSNIPVHHRSYQSEWQKSEQREARRDCLQRKAEAKYNQTAKDLPELIVGNHILLQDRRTGRWTVKGKIIEVGVNRNYFIKKSNGGTTWRNRKFIRKQFPIWNPPNVEHTRNHPVHHDTPPSPTVPVVPTKPDNVHTSPTTHDTAVKPDNTQTRDTLTHDRQTHAAEEFQPARTLRRRKAPDRLQMKTRGKTYE